MTAKDEPFVEMTEEAQQEVVREIHRHLPFLRWTFVEPNLPDVETAVVAESLPAEGWIGVVYRRLDLKTRATGILTMLLHAERGLKIFVPPDVAADVWERAQKSVRVVEKISTDYNDVAVRLAGERIDFAATGAIHSMWHPKRAFTGYVWDAITLGCLLAREPRNILILGLSGGTVARQLRALLPNARIVGVEIDKAMVSAAKRHMDLDANKIEVVTGDGYAFLQNSKEKYDIIIDDIYLGLKTGMMRKAPTDIASALGATVETPDARKRDMLRELALMKKYLAPGGSVVMNLLPPEGAVPSDHFEPVEAAFIESFPSVRIAEPARGTNEVLIGGDDLAREVPAHYFERLQGYDRAQAKLVEIS